MCGKLRAVARGRRGSNAAHMMYVQYLAEGWMIEELGFD
jgi:hypothetical protein